MCSEGGQGKGMIEGGNYADTVRCCIWRIILGGWGL